MENKYTVNLWPGAGYITFAIEVLASSEEDALTKAVERALAEDIPIYGFKDTEEKVNDLLSYYAKEYEAYDDYHEFFTSFLNYYYVGDLNYYVHMDNTKIEKGWNLYENNIPLKEEKDEV
ncbi:MAG: hypothetical protein EOM11_08150 [Erysipelotrichia bacterium]|nr:hypothetical protein [Erysipelotrichia bacterium]